MPARSDPAPADDLTTTKQERFTRLFLRVLGSWALVALPFAFLPYGWMNAIHQRLGMSILPCAPVVGYLARSTSLFYALLGGLLWVISSDVRRHRRVLAYLGWAVLFFGLMLLGIDWAEGMPRIWTFAEGPGDVLFGFVLLWLSDRLRPDPSARPPPAGG
jgi:hypothetical protein